MTRTIHREPPKGVDGYVVFPDPTHPGYTFAAVEMYWRLKPTFPPMPRGPFSDIRSCVLRAREVAKNSGGDVWVVRQTH